MALSGKMQGAVEPLTPADIRHFITCLGQQAQDDINWSENVKEPADSEAFALESIFVICNSGMKNTVAMGIFKRCAAALQKGSAVFEVFKHPGKAAAIEHIWAHRHALFADYLAATDKLAYLETLPWIGSITKFHLAKNFGANVAKPDIHLQRMADRQGCTVELLCAGLAEATGYRAATIDVILWRAAANGIIDSKTGRIAMSSANDDSASSTEDIQGGDCPPVGLFSGLIKSHAESIEVDVDDPATCSVCGCTDRHACQGGCYWVSVDRVSRTGVCSSCSSKTAPSNVLS